MHPPALPHLREIMLFLVAAGIVVPLLARLRFNPVLGYLLVGFLIGPYGLGLLTAALPWLSLLTITDLAGVQQLAELGVVFLLFVIGLELSMERLWALRRLVFGLGSAQVLLTAVLIALVALGFGASAEAATPTARPRRARARRAALPPSTRRRSCAGWGSPRRPSACGSGRTGRCPPTGPRTRPRRHRSGSARPRAVRSGRTRPDTSRHPCCG